MPTTLDISPRPAPPEAAADAAVAADRATPAGSFHDYLQRAQSTRDRGNRGGRRSRRRQAAGQAGRLHGHHLPGQRQQRRPQVLAGRGRPARQGLVGNVARAATATATPAAPARAIRASAAGNADPRDQKDSQAAGDGTAAAAQAAAAQAAAAMPCQRRPPKRKPLPRATPARRLPPRPHRQSAANSCRPRRQPRLSIRLARRPRGQPRRASPPSPTLPAAAAGQPALPTLPAAAAGQPGARSPLPPRGPPPPAARQHEDGCFAAGGRGRSGVASEQSHAGFGAASGRAILSSARRGSLRGCRHHGPCNRNRGGRQRRHGEDRCTGRGARRPGGKGRRQAGCGRCGGHDLDHRRILPGRPAAADRRTGHDGDCLRRRRPGRPRAIYAAGRAGVSVDERCGRDGAAEAQSAGAGHDAPGNHRPQRGADGPRRDRNLRGAEHAPGQLAGAPRAFGPAGHQGSAVRRRFDEFLAGGDAGPGVLEPRFR